MDDNASKAIAPVWLIVVGFACNNNCVLCSFRLLAKNADDQTTEAIKEKIDQGWENGYVRVEFTGGEPTIRPDICDLIAYAKSKGFSEVAVSTNGRMFGYEDFLDKAIDAGLNRVTLTLYGSKPEIHNAIARTPGSFKQTVEALKNIVANPRVKLSVNTVVCALNYRDLINTGNFIADLGAETWGILDLIPFGNAATFYKRLAVDFKDLALVMRSLQKIIGRIEQISLFDFPTCVLGFKLINNPHVTVFDARGRVEGFKQTGYNPERFESEKGVYTDMHKKRIDVCNQCVMKKRCAGVWKPYLDLYGINEINTRIKGMAKELLINHTDEKRSPNKSK